MNVTADRVAGFPGERFRFSWRTSRVPPIVSPSGRVGDPGDRERSAVRDGLHRRRRVHRDGARRRGPGRRDRDDLPHRPMDLASEDLLRPRDRLHAGEGRFQSTGDGSPGDGLDVQRRDPLQAPRRAEEPSWATLIHELGHVWEHQTGQAQLLRGVIEQIGRRLGRDPYDFEARRPATRADADLVHEGGPGADPDGTVEVEARLSVRSQRDAAVDARLRRGSRAPGRRRRDRHPTGGASRAVGAIDRFVAGIVNRLVGRVV